MDSPLFFHNLLASMHTLERKRVRLTEREEEREGERMTSIVFSLGTEAWINILLVTLSGRDRGCLSVPPLSSPLFSFPPLSLDHNPLWFVEVMFRVCRE